MNFLIVVISIKTKNTVYFINEKVKLIYGLPISLSTKLDFK